MNAGTLILIKVVEHRIDVHPESKPIIQHPYGAGPRSCDIPENNIQNHLDAGNIETAQTYWTSPYILSPKKNGTILSSVDLCCLNATTLTYTYPLPHMEKFSRQSPGCRNLSGAYCTSELLVGGNQGDGPRQDDVQK